MFPLFFVAIIVYLMISLTPYSLENPVEVSEEDYNKLVQIKEKGWSIVIQKGSTSQNCIISVLDFLKAKFL